MQIQITLDGEPLVLETPVTIADLLAARDLSPEILSVVRNGRVVSRSRYDSCQLEDGDELVAVVQVGGG